MSRRALFLDRDGVINYDFGYVHTVEEFQPLEENLMMIEGLMKKDDFLIFIITNQAGIGRGYYTEKQFLEFQAYIEKFLEDRGIDVQKSYYCPHHPTAGIGKYLLDCECRKPKPGMLLKAAEEFDLDLGKSIFVGDSEKDMEAGRAVGCEVIRV